MPSVAVQSVDEHLAAVQQLVFCPECRHSVGRCDADAQLASAVSQAFNETLLCGLRCSGCNREFPVLSDGIPLLWSDVLRDSLLRRQAVDPNAARANAREQDVKAANFFVYERVIHEYESKKIHANSVTTQRLHSALGEFSLPANARHLDVGCGPGNVLESTSDEQFTTKVGCDISLQALRTTKAKGYLVVLGDAERLPFRNETFDLITGHSLLHHLYEPKRFMAEAFRLLRPSGGLITDFDPNKHSAAYGPLAMTLFRLRKHLYRMLPGAHRTRFGRDSEELVRSNEVAEFHNAPGLGFAPEILRTNLARAGFRVRHIFLHNTLDPSIRHSTYCRPRLTNFVAQLLSLRNPFRRQFADAVLTSSEKVTTTADDTLNEIDTFS
jgi:ubiquinone/menaquinone biosynthesis C-methylase UbiE/uncharacterized protein YbaR (Trm112 family)